MRLRYALMRNATNAVASAAFSSAEILLPKPKNPPEASATVFPMCIRDILGGRRGLETIARALLAQSWVAERSERAGSTRSPTRVL